MSDRALAEGCAFSWASATSVAIGPGLLRVGGALLASNGSTTLALGSMSPSTLYAIYAYSNAGVRALEKSTDVPEWDAALGYWKKTGDASRRRVGWVRTDGAGAMIRFRTPPKRLSRVREIWWQYEASQITYPFSLVSVSPTAWTSFSLAGLVPADATGYSLKMYGVDSAMTGFFVGISSDNWNTEGYAIGAEYEFQVGTTAGQQTGLQTGFIPLNSLTNYVQISDQYGADPSNQSVTGTVAGFCYEI